MEDTHSSQRDFAYETTNFSNTETNYYAALANHDEFEDEEHIHSSGSNVHYEITAVGAGVGGGFDHTSDLHVMNYKQAMQTKDKNKWKKAVEEEIKSFEKHGVFKPVKRKDVPATAKIVTST